MNDSKLRYEVSRLISLKQEGDYWDFKREWYTNKSDLLHDILCMANNLTSEDGLIIIGVDEENNYMIKNVENDPNRKSTQNLVDFLKDKKFAGGIRPTVYIETVVIQKNKVDIIVVKNDNRTPYFLTEKYGEIYANNIYTRIMDTNTPKKSSADIDKIEFLWKKRFGINISALEKAKRYLEQKADWVEPCGGTLYYKFAPEFTIKYSPSEERSAYEFYLFGQTDSRPGWYDIDLYYHSTLLISFAGVALDGARCFTSAPTWGNIDLGKNKENILYKFFIIDSLEYALHRFFVSNEREFSEENTARERFLECILVLNSEDEQDRFEKYVCEHQEYLERDVEDYRLPYFPNLQGYNMDEMKKRYKNSLLLNEMLIDFRSQLL